MSAHLAPGDLDLAGFANLRDVGGLGLAGGGSIRPLTLLRSDAAVEADPDELAELAAAGVRLAVDLRDDDEVALVPSPFAAAGWRVVRHPVFEGSAAHLVAARVSLAALYRQVVDERGDVLAAVARTVAQAGVGVVVHCTAGKDRTGLAVGVLLSAVGVADDVVVGDYARTQERLGGAWARRRLAELSAAHGRDLSDQAELLTLSPAQVLAGTLAHLRSRWGSAAGYLRAHGLSAAELAALVDTLVEPGRPQ